MRRNFNRCCRVAHHGGYAEYARIPAGWVIPLPDGLDLHEAVVTAAMLRLRPIFLTTITTVAGLLPLAMSGAASPLLSPMANAMCWGLSFATVLTLVLIPCLYYAFEDIARIGSRLFGPFARWITDPGGAIDEERDPPPA